MLKKLSQIFAVAAIGFLGAPETEAQTNIRFPSEHVETLDTNGVSALRADFSRTQLGRDLLDLADQHGATIGFDSLMNRAGEYDPTEKKISLHPSLSAEERLVFLSHEIWHLRQDVVQHSVAWQEAPLMPSRLFALLQYQEGDAFAFSSYFWADSMKELEQNPESVLPGRAIAEFFFANNLRYEMETDGLSAAEYRFAALEPNLMRLAELGYIDTHLKQTEQNVSTIRALADTAEACLSAGDTLAAKNFARLGKNFFSQAPDDMDVEYMLRGYGGFNIAAGGETALESRATVSMQKLEDYTVESGDPLMTQVTRNVLESFDEVYKKSRSKIEHISSATARYVPR